MLTQNTAISKSEAGKKFLAWVLSERNLCNDPIANYIFSVTIETSSTGQISKEAPLPHLPSHPAQGDGITAHVIL